MKPITHISLNLAPDARVNSMLLSLRVVPDGREGNVVYGRTLRYGADDDGEGIVIREGERFAIRKGRLTVDLEYVDSLSGPGRWGYAPVTNTIWTWYELGPKNDPNVYLALTSLARRVDTAYALWGLVLAERQGMPDRLSFHPDARSSIFKAWGAAEVAVIALHRAFRLVTTLELWLGVEAPESVASIVGTVQVLRDALEHIDERADGLVRGKPEAEAYEIFNQAELVMDGTLTHGNHTGIERESLMEHTLFAVDELSGFIRAVTLVRPNKSLDEVTAGSVRRKMKDKAFARDVNRDDIYQGAEELGVDLDEHITFIIEALKPVAERIGLNTGTPQEGS